MGFLGIGLNRLWCAEDRVVDKPTSIYKEPFSTLQNTQKQKHYR